MLKKVSPPIKGQMRVTFATSECSIFWGRGSWWSFIAKTVMPKCEIKMGKHEMWIICGFERFISAEFTALFISIKHSLE